MNVVGGRIGGGDREQIQTVLEIIAIKNQI